MGKTGRDMVVLGQKPFKRKGARTDEDMGTHFFEFVQAYMDLPAV